MAEHTLCPECARRAGHLLSLKTRPHPRCKLLGDVVITKPIERSHGATWYVRDRLVASTAPEQRGDADVLWHVRVVNISRKHGETHAALCHLPLEHVAVIDRRGERPWSEAPGIVEFKTRELEKSVPPRWARFLPQEQGGKGRWTRALPTRPGMYPVRGAAPPTHLHTIRVAGRIGRCVYLDENDTELAPESLTKTLWIWSEPMPALPPPPTKGHS